MDDAIEMFSSAKDVMDGYQSRLEEVLLATGELTDTDLEYCKLLIQNKNK